MRISLTISSRAAILAGNDAAGLRVVDVPVASLDARQREELALWPVTHGIIELTPTWQHAQGYHEALSALPEATPATVAELLTVYSTIRADIAAQDAARKAAEAAADAQAVREWCAQPLTDRIERDNYGTRPWAVTRCRGDHSTTPEYAEALAECRRRNDEAEAAKAAAKAATDAAKSHGLLALAEWARTHGSELLRRRMAEGFEWAPLANHEWVDQYVAGIALHPSEVDEAVVTDSTRPTLAELDALAAVRKALPNDTLVELIRVTPKGHEEDEAEPETHTEIRVTGTTLEGGKWIRDYLVG